MKSNRNRGLFLVPCSQERTGVAFEVPLPEAPGALQTGDEQKEQIAKLAAELTTEHQPQGPTEVAMVQNMASARWRASHGVQLQAQAEKTLDWDRISILERYRATNEKSFRMALKSLKALQKARPRPVLVNGTKPIRPKPTAEC